ncbi:MAG: FecR domain-containing protein [Chitinispirillaceae bacterium]|nr:FecR domain-containing protein [Chitinispirillaceae bacterium]
MQRDEKEFRSFLEQGFSTVPADAEFVRGVATFITTLDEMDTDCGIHHNIRSFSWKKYLPIGLAALLFLSVFSYVTIIKMAGNPTDELIDKLNAGSGADTKEVSVISSINTDLYSTGDAIRIRETVTNDEDNQLLFSIGKYVTILLFENSSVRILEAADDDSHIQLLSGNIAVSVVPGKIGKFEIETKGASFTVVGTFFSVSADSGRTELRVYRGKVCANGKRMNKNVIVEKNQQWSDKKEIVSDVNMDEHSLRLLEKVFKSGKISSKITLRKSRKMCGTPDRKRRTITKKMDEKKENAVNLFTSMIAKDMYQEGSAILRGIAGTPDADTVCILVLKLADRKIDHFRFTDAQTLLEMVIDIFPESIYAENAYIRLFNLHKSVGKSSSEQLLIMCKQYLSRFPEGNFVRELKYEKIILLQKLKQYRECYHAISLYRRKYLNHEMDDYLLYLNATLLREHIGDKKNAVQMYRECFERYPQSRYAEDALYWIIKTSDETDRENYAFLYKKNYPEGRWIAEITSVSK